MKKLTLFLGGILLSAGIYAQSNLEKEFKDEFNISGVYHLSKTVTIYLLTISKRMPRLEVITELVESFLRMPLIYLVED